MISTRRTFDGANRPQTEEVEEITVSISKCEGLALKSQNTITQRWPHRLVHSQGDQPTLQAFNRFLGWPHEDVQRWVEWKRTDDFQGRILKTWLGWLDNVKTVETTHPTTAKVNDLLNEDWMVQSDRENNDGMDAKNKKKKKGKGKKKK